jgi:tetratricopeptide (TPR) repeat protein/tRNA A-37 threonylcarbamoyl transferase component Bud32
MPLDERISDLLLQWEEAREQGRDLTPEELCRDCPEFLAEVARHIQALRKLAPLLDTRDTDVETPPPAPPPTPHASVSPALGVAKGESRYTPTKFHSAGGLGEVYKAHDEELRRDVALKQIKEELANNPACRREFLREAEITGKLEHPGVVPIYGLVQGPDGNPAYAMRFIEGESLRDAIRKFHEADHGKRDPGERTLALRQLLSRFIAVCNTVAFAHNRGVIHRDLKPANIMLGKYGETLVVDWGLARPFDRTETERASGEATLRHTPRDGDAPDATRLGEVKGTPSYMSPEQAEGMWDSVGPASDVYSLGATLYELLTGVSPVRGRDGRETILKVRRGEFPPPRAVKPNVPKPLEAICLKAMALTPADRYQKADDLAKDLETWLADEPVAAYREPWLARVRRVTRRHRPLVASVTVGVLVAVLLGGGGSVWLWRQHDLDQQLKRHDVEPTLKAVEEVLEHPEKSLKEAEDLLKQADGRLASGGPSELREQLRLRQREVELAKVLEQAALGASPYAGARVGFRAGDRAYAAAFADLGLDVSGPREQEVTEVIRTSILLNRLILALDYWAYCKDEIDPKSGSKLRTLADSVDDDPWRRRVRLAVQARNMAELEELARDERSVEQPSINLSLLGVAIFRRCDRAAAENWLLKANERHPQELSINLLLAQIALQKEPPEPGEALHFCQAALAAHPHNPEALILRGMAWHSKKDYDRAIRVYNEAMDILPDDPVTLVNRGLSWHEKKEYDRAIRDYDEAIRLLPDCAPAFNNRGFAWHERKDYDQAIRDFDEAIRLDRNPWKTFNNRGDSWKAKRDYDRAIRDYDEAIRLHPNNSRAFNNRGIAWAEKKDFNQAMRDFDEVIRLDPGNAQAFSNRGNIWQDMKDYDRAICDFDQAISLDPNHARTIYNRGNAWCNKRQWDKAIKDYDDAIRIDPSFALAFHNRGIAWREQKDYNRAMRDLDEAIRLDPNDARAVSNRGTAWAEMKNFERAIRDYDDALRLDPRLAEAFRDRGNAWRQQKDYDRGMRDLDEAIRLDPNDARAFNSRGTAWAEMNQFDRAIRDYDDAIRLDPEFARAFNNRGQAWYDKSDYDRAMRDFDAAIRLDPNFAPAFYNRGNCWDEKKDYDRAIRDYDEAIRLDPHDAMAYYNRGLTYSASLKQFSKGESDFRKAVELSPKYVKAWVNLGRSLREQERFDEAREAFRNALKLTPEESAMYPHVIQDVRTCERLIALDKKLPDTLKGDDRPANPVESIQLAQLCQQYHKQYAAAARFYAEAFEAQAEFVNDPRAGHRYHAGCSAALAGSGQGKDADMLDDKDRPRLRKQARDWLRADLVFWAKQAKSQKAEDRAMAVQSLKHWQEDPDLAGVRDKSALEKQPDAERAEWEKLWADVAALLKQAPENFK